MSPSRSVGRIEPPLTRTNFQPNTMAVSIGQGSLESSLAERLAGRDAALWHARGRLALFAIGVALGLGALITFVAHNWTYLNTVAKLGLIAALLVTSAVVWMVRRFEGHVAEIAGIAAQGLIGVWLAAAGQLYQAPGQVGDLTLRWAVLGLPFALASRSRAHWAVWAAVATLTVLAGGDWSDNLNRGWRFALGAVVMGVGYLVSGMTLRGWSASLFAALAALLLAMAGIHALGDGEIQPLLALFAALGSLALFALGYLRQQSLAPPSLAAAAMAVIVGLALIRTFVPDGADEVMIMLFVTLVIGGVTFALIRLFGWLRDRFGRSDESPWYMDALGAVGGILTALFGASFLLALLVLLFDATRTVEVALVLVGLLLYGVGLALRLRAVLLFRRYLTTTVMLIGGAATVTGLVTWNGFDNAALIGASVVLLALVPFLLVRERIVEVIMALAIAVGVGMVVWDVFDVSLDAGLELTAILYFAVMGTLAFAALFALNAFPRLAAVPVWLLAASAILLIANLDGWVTRSRLDDLAANAPALALTFGVLFGLLASAKATVLRGHLPGWVVLAALGLLAVLLPMGAAPVVLLLLLGYGIGSRTLFCIGLVASFGYLFAAYFDLSMTLMEMSAAMAVSAVVTLGLWWAAKGRLA